MHNTINYLKILGRVTSICLIIIMTLSLVACKKDDGAGHSFKYSLSSDPKNLDPQLSEDEASLVVLRNLYLGLLRETSLGSLASGVAEDYTVSDDGLVYTFELSDKFFWYQREVVNDTTSSIPTPEPIKVTANDFVFAFQRVVLKETKSPYADKFFGIKNAKEIYEGKKDVSELGIKALSDYKLEITLNYTDANFLYFLTTMPTMPCNEQIFLSTKGKYGLEAITTASNGPFYLKSWIYDPYGKDNYLILNRNEKYSEVSRVYPYSISFLVDKAKSERISDFFDGTTDCYVDNGLGGDFFKSDYDYQEFENTSSGIVFNPNNEVLKIEEVRKALTLCIDRTEISKTIPKTLRISNGLIPSSVKVLNKSFRELSAEVKPTFDTALSQYLWTASLTTDEKRSLNNASILVPQSYEYSEYISEISNKWNQTLGFYCRVDVVPDSEYATRISEGDYTLALVEIKGDYNSPRAFLDFFGANKQLNITKFNDKNFEDILYKVEKLASISESVSYYRELENYLINGYHYIPIFYQKDYLFTRKNVKDLIYDPFSKQIMFEYSKKF